MSAATSDSVEAAKRLLDKLRRFVWEQLDEQESELLALLLAPGISRAYPEDDDSGFGAEWQPDALAGTLAQALHDGGMRLEGLQIHRPPA